MTRLLALDDDNPKTALGARKPDVSLIPPAALIYMALGMGNGAEKYGPYNWRKSRVSGRTYVAAACRHMLAWLDGEDNDESTGGSKLPHLAHALSSLAILADAIETGNLIDDRPPPGAAGVLIDKWTKRDVTPAPVVPQGPRSNQTPPSKARKSRRRS